MEDESTGFRRVKEIFNAALDLEPGERQAFLDSACGGDETLRGRVSDLLAADEATGNPLDETVAGLGARLLTSSAAGQRIGPHRLLREIGRGGMGTIYLAVRDDGQYREEVAIKLIRSGMDNAGIVRRFRQERQILANLHHPNIARVLDGGLTEVGLPYFVMEHIDGEPIDRYCDNHRLSTAQRLELFLSVCGAVQAAHGRLVVHCDLKPSNILVTKDGIPKLLDFGIARLLEPGGTSGSATMTGSGRMMTPEYASPEQIRGEALSTASDVYSLAGVLYRLLTGRRPYRLETNSLYEIERAVCEQEPEKPSAAISRSADQDSDSLEHLSAVRGSSLATLRRRLAGDLDNIVLKGLAKQPEQRYGSADRLAEDLRRHLRGLPVLARQPTLRYHTAKFVRRHWVSLQHLGMLHLDGGRLEEAEAALVEALNLWATSLGDASIEASDSLNSLGLVRQRQRRLEETGALFRRALTLRRRLLSGDHLKITASLNNLAGVLRREGELEEAEALYREVLTVRRRSLDEEHPRLATTLNNLARVLSDRGEFAEAEALYLEALKIQEALGRLDRVATILNNLGRLRERMGDLEEAEALLDRSVKVFRQVPEVDEARIAFTLEGLGDVQLARDKRGEAEATWREALDLLTRRFGAEHREVASTVERLGRLLCDTGQLVEGESLLRRSLQIRRSSQAVPRDMARSERDLGSCLIDSGQFGEAEEFLHRSLETLAEVASREDPEMQAAGLLVTKLEAERGGDRPTSGSGTR